MGCNDDTPYAGRLIGNSPELNPLDCSLFADLTSAIIRHMCLTSHMDEKYAMKFTLTVTGKITSVVDRLWNPHSPCAITPERIAIDIKKVLRSMHTIVEYKGTIVPHLGNRNGIRAENSGQGSGGSGRQLIRSLHMPSSSEYFTHPDVGSSTTDVLIATTLKFEGVLLLESSPEAPFRAFVNNLSKTAGADRASFRAKNLPVADWTGDDDDDDEDEEYSDNSDDDAVDTPALASLNILAVGQKRNVAAAGGGSRKASRKADATDAEEEKDSKKQCP